MPIKTAKGIIKESLKSMSADGLVRSDTPHACCCPIDDLMPCGVCEDCMAAELVDINSPRCRGVLCPGREECVSGCYRPKEG